MDQPVFARVDHVLSGDGNVGCRLKRVARHRSRRRDGGSSRSEMLDTAHLSVQSRGSVDVFFQPERESLEASTTESFSPRPVITHLAAHLVT